MRNRLIVWETEVVSAVAVAISFEGPDSELASSLLCRYQDELALRFPGCFDLDKTIGAPTEELKATNGAFLVVRLDRQPVGCGAVRKLDEISAEGKREWTDPAVRGHSVGKRRLRFLEVAASELVCSRVPRFQRTPHRSDRSVFDGRLPRTSRF